MATIDVARRTPVALLPILLILVLAACAPGGPGPLDVKEPGATPQTGECQGAASLLAADRLNAAEERYTGLLNSTAEGKTSSIACASEGLALIGDRRGKAAQAVRDGDRALAAGDQARAAEWYGRALDLDADNAAAASGLSTVTEQQQGTAEGFAARWDGRMAAWVEPVVRLVLPWLAITVALFLLARAATYLVNPRWRTKREGLQRFCYITALAAVPVVAAGWVAAAAVKGVPVWSFAGMAGVSILAVVLCGIAFGRRLRLLVQGAGDHGDAATYVAARLRELGSDRPAGLRITQGTDVTDLPDQAVDALPGNQVVAALVRVARLMLPTTPWRAKVSHADGTVVVSLTRNGRFVDAVTIDRSLLDTAPAGRPVAQEQPDPADRDRLLTAAAAFVLLELSKVHRVLTHGLAGATRWKSLAWQVVAADRAYERSMSRVELYARAIDHDPRNLAAWLGYFQARAGATFVDADQQRQLADWLENMDTFLTEKAKNGSEWETVVAENPALFARLQFSRAAAWLNYRVLLPAAMTQEKGHAVRRATDAVAKLKNAIRNADSGDGQLRLFAKEIKPVADVLDTHVRHFPTAPCPEHPAATAGPGVPWRRHEQIGQSLRTHYARAAYLAEHNLDARPELVLATGLARLRESSRTDPSFRTLRGRDWFWPLVGERRALTDLKAIQPDLETLKTLGLCLPEQLAGRPETDEDLAQAMGVPAAKVAWWRGLCRLAVSCPDRDEAIPWTDLLVAEGIGTPAALAAYVRSPGPATLARRLTSHAARFDCRPPADVELSNWARVPAQWLAAPPAPAAPATPPASDQAGGAFVVAAGIPGSRASFHLVGAYGPLNGGR